MEPVKTCATCRHSTVGRRDPMDWWKLRLCAHPGLVDRVEGRPLYSCVKARGREGACGCAGTLWEAVPATGYDPTRDIEKLTRVMHGDFSADPVDEASALGPGVLRVYNDKTQGLDPVDEAVEAAHRTAAAHDLPQSFNHQATMTGARMKLERDEAALFSGDLPQGEGLTVRINPALLPRKPARQRKPRAPREGIE